MAPFNFHSIQTLEINQADSPIIDIKDGRLVLTAVRGDERIMITAPMVNNPPRLTTITAKTIQTKTKRHKVHRQVLPTTDKRVGATNPLSKLNEEKVREILLLLSGKEMRRKYSSAAAFYTEIGKAYGVGHHTICNIDRGVSWKHVAR
jgi:hypothetical protein